MMYQGADVGNAAMLRKPSCGTPFVKSAIRACAYGLSKNEFPPFKAGFIGMSTTYGLPPLGMGAGATEDPDIRAQRKIWRLVEYTHQKSPFE